VYCNSKWTRYHTHTHQSVMSVSHVMSATSVRSNIPVPIWPSSLTAQLNVYEEVLATVDWNMSASLSVCCAPHKDPGPRTKDQDKQRSVILPAREILLNLSPETTSQASGHRDGPAADCRLQNAESRPPTAVAQLPTLECAG